MSHHATVAQRGPTGSRPLFVALVLTVCVSLAPFATPTARASDETSPASTSTTSPALPSLAHTDDTDVDDTPPVPTAPEGDGSEDAGLDGRSTWNIVAEPDAEACPLLTDRPEDEPLSCSSPAELTLPSELASDVNDVVEAVSTDSSGRTSEVGTSPPSEVGTTPPATPTLVGPAGQDNDPQPVWTFGDIEPGTHPACTLRGPDESAVPVVCGPEGVTVEPLLLDGAYVLDVVHTDAAGIRSPTASVTYVLDTTPPASPTFLVEPTGPSLSPRVEWRLAPDPQAAAVVCTLRKDAAPIDTRGCDDTTYSRDLTSLGAGVFALAVSAIDDLGNASAASVSRPYTYRPAVLGPIVWDSYPGSTHAVPLAEPGQTGSPGVAPVATPFLFHGEDDATFHCLLARGPEQDAAHPVAERGCDGPAPGTGRFVLDDVSTAEGGTYWLTVTGSRPEGVGVSVMSFVLDLSASDAWVFTPRFLARPEALPVTDASPTAPTTLTRLTTLSMGYLPDRPAARDEAVASPGPAPLTPRPVIGLQPVLTAAATVRQGPITREPAGVSQKAALAAPSLPERLLVPGVPGAMPRALPDLVGETVTRPTLPLALGTMMLLFLFLQNRIDRRDPKLSVAASDLEPDLEFEPTLRAQAAPRPR